MNVLCAPDSFKGTAAADVVAEAMVAGVGDAGASGVPLPIGDGGEGTADAIAASGYRWIDDVATIDALGRPIRGRYLVSEDGTRAVIELAEASGLARVAADERDILQSTTYGTGVLIGDAIAHGVREVIVAVGGSATCDGGAGMLAALGTVFRDAEGIIVERPRPVDLARVRSFEAPVIDVAIRVACDVRSPLLGSEGAAAVYGPQKGASADDVESLDSALAHFARILGADHASVPGAGAAGGAAFGLSAGMQARLESGIDLVCSLLDVDARMAEADAVVTGEGCFDRQSAAGKACLGIAERAHLAGCPVALVAGAIDAEADVSAFSIVTDLTARVGKKAACAEPVRAVREATADVVRRMLHE